jgi:EF-hand domain
VLTTEVKETTMYMRLFGIAAALLMMGGTADAQSNPALTSGQADFLDTNKDSAVSPQEYSGYLSNAFNYLDTNKNGSLSRDEFGDLISDEQFSAIDSNGSGRVSRQELLNQGAEDFATADKDGSGKLQ